MAKKSKSDKAKRATAIVANVFANVLASKGLSKLHEQTFMQAAEPKAGEKAGINMKKAAADLGVTAGGAVLALMVPGDISLAIGSGLAAAGVNSGIDTVRTGMNGMGDVDDVLDLYKSENQVSGTPEEEAAKAEAIKLSGVTTSDNGLDDKI